MAIKIYHNPKCSKSRATLQLLKDNGVEPEIIEYLKTPPSREELTRVLDALGMQPRELMRTHESEYKEASLDDTELTTEQLIQAMLDYPRLIERPIVINGSKVAIGRPPEQVLDIL